MFNHSIYPQEYSFFNLPLGINQLIHLFMLLVIVRCINQTLYGGTLHMLRVRRINHHDKETHIQVRADAS